MLQQAHDHHELGFLKKYVFSGDHKVIGKQFFFTALFFYLIGGTLALGVRFQLGWPNTPVPVLGSLFGWKDGIMSTDGYNMLFTMHATVMIFLVIIPMLVGAFGNWVTPLQLGARDMAFPTLNMLSYWMMWPAFLFFMGSFFVQGGAAQSGWTEYASLSEAPWSPGLGTTFWCAGLFCAGASSIMGSVNYITTIVKMRAPGMTMFRMPMTTWAVFITSILVLFATPVVGATGLMLIVDRTLGSSFFMPEGLTVSRVPVEEWFKLQGMQGGHGGGQVLMYQHLFWFYSHPAVYIMILIGMGMASDVIACNARKPLFGYRPMVYSIAGIAGLGFIVWGHHMFTSGMNPYLAMSFMISTMMIALPSAVKVFNWLGTLWGGNIRFNVPMLHSLAFVSMFVIGGLSGIFMAATPVDMYLHDTYFIVAHIHYVLFGGTTFAIFSGAWHWFPKMWGRMFHDGLAKVHFWLTFVAFNCTFFPMHIIGAQGHLRRLAKPDQYELLKEWMGMNQFISISAFVLGGAQVLFVINYFWSMFKGKPAPDNPWHANSLEWQTPTPPGHGNFDRIPTVYRGPYEYSSPEVAEDYLPQNRELPASR
jgi:cytochrome c oxidase subunit 1